MSGGCTDPLVWDSTINECVDPGGDPGHNFYSGASGSDVTTEPTGHAPAPLDDCGGSTCGDGAHCEDSVYGKHCVQDNAGSGGAPASSTGNLSVAQSAVPKSGPGVSYTPATIDPGLWAILNKGITDELSGAMAPYNADTINAQKAQIFQATQGRAAAAKDSLGADLIRRGLTRSGIAAEDTSNIDRAASTDFTTQFVGVLTKAAEENYKAKVAALTQAQQLIATKLQGDLANARNGLDASIAQSTATLGYARIQEEMVNLQSQLQSAYDLANMGDQDALVRLLISSGLSQSDIVNYLNQYFGGK